MDAIATSERVRTTIELGESHFREFKSALEGEPGKKKKRPIKDIATNIAQTLVAFANADGGELLIGVEDSGIVSGLDNFSEEEINQLKEAPTTRIHKDTPLPVVRKLLLEIDNHIVLYFAVSKSTQYIHLTSDGRCLQRRDLESLPVSSEAIHFDRKEVKSREYDRTFVDGALVDELDIDLVKIVADQIMKGMSPEKCLQYLELGEYGLSQLKLRKAALLLFAKNPYKWHPRLQIRIIKVDGEELKTGEEYVVISDNNITGNIIKMVEDAWDALRPHLVHTRIDKSARFEQKSIYPELACREALLNAIAHRDYSDEGRGIEVFIFTNRLVIKNPGALLSSIKLEDIINQKGVHQSRNSYISRVLRELGYMRELGEGLRRIYDLMHKNELASPLVESSSDGFSITLTHRPLYSEKDLLWLSNFDNWELDREQKSVLLLGQDARIFSAQEIWDAIGIVDTEHYRKLVSSLANLSILKNKIEPIKAKNLARRNKIPYKQYPRFIVEIPKDSRQKPENKPNNQNSNITPIKHKRLYISNIPFNAKKDSIYNLLSKYGEISTMFFPEFNGKNKGYCFVDFESDQVAQALISAKYAVEFEGRNLTIRIANPREKGS